MLPFWWVGVPSPGLAAGTSLASETGVSYTLVMPSLLEATHWYRTKQQRQSKRATDRKLLGNTAKLCHTSFPIGNRKECNGSLCARNVIQIRIDIHCVLPSGISTRPTQFIAIPKEEYNVGHAHAAHPAVQEWPGDCSSLARLRWFQSNASGVPPPCHGVGPCK